MKLFITLFSMVLVINVVAQDKYFSSVYIQPKGGYLLAHRKTMAHLVQNNAYAFECGTIKYHQTTSLDTAYRFPITGFNFEYRNFGYDEVLGYAGSVGHYFSVPIHQFSSGYFIDLLYGAGLGYISKKNDFHFNPKNNAIGSHVNAKLNIKLLLSRYIGQAHWGLGIEMNHFSNGNLTHPNLGLNSVSLLASFGYASARRAVVPQLKKELVVDKSQQFLGAIIGGVSQVSANPDHPKRYPVFGFRATFQQQLSRFWHGDISLDFIQNEANRHVFLTGFKPMEAFQIGVYLGGAYQFYKSEIIMGVGYYLLDQIKALGPFYNKLGYRYYFKPNWFGLCAIKANVGKADYIEFGIGYKLIK